MFRWEEVDREQCWSASCLYFGKNKQPIIWMDIRKFIITIQEIVIWIKMPFYFQLSNSNKLNTVHGLYVFLELNLFVQHNPKLSYIFISAHAHESVCYNLRIDWQVLESIICISVNADFITVNFLSLTLSHHQQIYLQLHTQSLQ